MQAGTRARIAVALLVCVAAASVLAGSSNAVPRKRAVAIALKALAPAKVKGSVVVYGLPTPLAAGSVVSEAGPSGTARTSKVQGRAQLVSHVRSWKTAGKTWLFWADLGPGAYWSHPSRLVLVDDATGRVTVSAKLGWWPLVNGRPAKFVVHPAGFSVFSKLPPKRKTSGSRAAASATIPSVDRFAFEKDCIVFVVDETAPGIPGENLRGDLAQMKAWARSAGLGPRSADAKSAAELEVEVDRLVKDGCNDVVVFLAGHGLAEPGTLVNGEPVGTSDEATVLIGNTVRKVGGGYETVQNPVTSSDLGKIAGKYRKKTTVNGREITVSPVKFKLIVDSCFSGRFEDDLADYQKGEDPPIREIATSSTADVPTVASGFGTQGPNPNNASYWILGLTKVLTQVVSQTNGSAEGDLAAIIDQATKIEAADSEKYDDFANHLNHHQSSFAPGTLHPFGEPLNPPRPEPIPPAFHVHVHFIESERQSMYSIVYDSPPSSPPFKYLWHLDPPPNDPDCSNVDHGGTGGTNPTFFWYHGSDQCSHAAEDPDIGHQGTVTATLTFVFFECTASIRGTQGKHDGSDGDGAKATCKKT